MKKASTAMEYALFYLHRIPKTKKEMKAKMLEKGYYEKDADATISQLEQMGLINDTRFVEMYAHSELIRKGKPLFRVKGKLLQKGIDPVLMDTVLGRMEAEVSDGIDEQIVKEIEKLKKKGLEGYDIMVKLHQKGYTVDQIRKVVSHRE